MNKANSTLLGALLLLTTFGPGCDVHLLPDTGVDAGGQSTRLEVSLGSIGAETLGDEVEGVRLTIVDVLAHNEMDDTWIILNAREVQLDLLATTRSDLSKEFPVAIGGYDRIMVVLSGAAVLHNDTWQPATVKQMEVELNGNFLINEGSDLQIDFDLFGALLRSPSEGWSFEPRILAYVS
ncbi:MAG: DUF4382 domain-containing protein [Nannocystaceae bacterium]